MQLPKFVFFGVIAGIVFSLLLAVFLWPHGKAVSGEPIKLSVDGLPREGSKNAPVEIWVVEDFKCPVCGMFERDVLPGLRASYLESGKASLVSVTWPFLASAMHLADDDSSRAAQAGMCVHKYGGDDAFLAFKQEMFIEQGDERESWATQKMLSDVMIVAGLSAIKPQVDRCVQTGQMAKAAAALRQRVEASGINATPTVLVNGVEVADERGNASWQLKDIRRTVEALGQAKAAVD